MKKVALAADMIKYKLSLAVMFSAVTGYFIAGGVLNFSLLLLCFGIFLLSSGAAALNQFTESDTDALMTRTRNRAIPSKSVSRSTVRNLAFLLILAGIILLSATGIIPVLLGLCALLLYNVVYTGLKKITIFSVVPGAMVGAIPPLIGYFAAGSSNHPGVIFLFSAFMFMWQIPHFWLILIRYRDDYNRVGFRTFREEIPGSFIKFMVFFWVLITSAGLIIFSVLNPVFSQGINLVLVILNPIFIILFCTLLFGKKYDPSLKGAFILVNSFSLLVMIMFIVNSFIG